MRNQKNNLKFRSTFFLVGINLALGAILALFNWTMVQGKANLEDPVGVSTFFPPFVLIQEEKQVTETQTNDSKRMDLYKVDNDIDDKPSKDPIIKTNKKFAINMDSFLKYKEEKTPLIKMVSLKDEKIYEGLDAEFVGGSFQDFVKNQIRVPGIANDLELTGTVVLQFVVEKNGKVTDIRVVTPKEMWMGYGVEPACVNVIKMSSGRWKPGKVNKKPVRTLFRIPIEIDYSYF